MTDLDRYRKLLTLIATLPEDELWKAQGLEDELEGFWAMVRASWEAKLPGLLESQSEPDRSVFDSVKPFDDNDFDAAAFYDELIQENIQALEGLRKLGD